MAGVSPSRGVGDPPLPAEKRRDPPETFAADVFEGSEFVRTDKLITLAARCVDLPTSRDLKYISSALASAVPPDLARAWDDLEGDSEGRIAIALANPDYACIVTSGVMLPTYLEELAWVVDAAKSLGLGPSNVALDIGSGAGLTAAVIAKDSGAVVVALDAEPGSVASATVTAQRVGCVTVRPEQGRPSTLLFDSDLDLVITQAFFSTVWTDTSAAPSSGLVPSGRADFAQMSRRDPPADAAAVLELVERAGEWLVVDYAARSDIWRWILGQAGARELLPDWDGAILTSGISVLPAPDPSRPKLCARLTAEARQRPMPAAVSQALCI